MSELKYGTVTLPYANNTANGINFQELADIFGWKYIGKCYSNINKGGVTLISGWGSCLILSDSVNFPAICSIVGWMGIANPKIGDQNYYAIHATGANLSTFSTRKVFARYVMNEETGDWIISITDRENYDNNTRDKGTYAVLIGTTLDDGKKVIFAPDGTMLYLKDDNTFEESRYKALYDDIGANFDSVITQETMLFDFFVVNIDTGELKTISSRLKYSTLYSGNYEPVKFEEKSSGDTYVLLPGAIQNSIAVCLKEVITYDVD